jgi:hypothetical protein
MVDPRGRRGFVPKVDPEPDNLVLECADCGFVARSIHEAEIHELQQSRPDEPHGGWDTKRLG